MALKTRFALDELPEIGIDEAGRGPLWGPLMAGAVLWPDEEDWTDAHRELVPRIQDSKKLTAKKRQTIYEQISELATAYGIGTVSPEEIDAWGATRANQTAFQRALNALVDQVEIPENTYRVLIDGILPMSNLDESIQQETVVDGDATYLSIAAASIVAKVSHDTWVEKWCSQNVAEAARYDLLSCKGYGTAKHRAGIQKYGYTDLHRRLYLRKMFPDIVVKRLAIVEDT
jgi:ribonuclease HII